MEKFPGILILIGGLVIISSTVSSSVDTFQMTIGCMILIAAFVLFISELRKI